MMYFALIFVVLVLCTLFVMDSQYNSKKTFERLESRGVLKRPSEYIRPCKYPRSSHVSDAPNTALDNHQ